MSPLDRFIRALLIGHRGHTSLASHDARRQFVRAMVLGGIMAPTIGPAIITHLSEDPRIRLLKRMARGDREATEAFAAFVSQPILQVIDQAPVISSLYATSLWTRSSV